MSNLSLDVVVQYTYYTFDLKAENIIGVPQALNVLVVHRVEEID
jgi:hypothetical protein